MLSTFTAVDCILLYSYSLPVELRDLIKSYLYQRIETNEALRKVIQQFFRGSDGDFNTSSKREDCVLRYGDMSYWETGKITDMSKLFTNYASQSKEIPSLQAWDVSCVTTMQGMFSNCSHFNQPLNSWDVRQVVNMSSLFYGCVRFNQPLNKWDVSHSVRSMDMMFANAKAFNQSLDTWDLKNVESLKGMFAGTSAYQQHKPLWKDTLINTTIRMAVMRWMQGEQTCIAIHGHISHWDVSKVTDMNRLFAQHSDFNQPLSDWDVSNVIDMTGMFEGCTLFNQPIDTWDTRNVISMKEMFANAKSFNQSLTHWDVRRVIDMSSMFSGCQSFNQVLSKWEVHYGDTIMTKMFERCPAGNISHWDKSDTCRSDANNTIAQITKHVASTRSGGKDDMDIMFGSDDD